MKSHSVKHHTRPPSSRPSRFPLATLAAYGPDNTVATKLVVSIIDRPEREPSASQVWTTEAVDVRQDTDIAAEVTRFLEQHRVKDSVSPDRIIGCPHQEGIDYPMGRTCPRCPFWAGIDRFTHEPLTPPLATMSPEEILDELAADRPVPPREALDSADAHRAALVDPLLGAIDAGIARGRGASPQEAALFAFALYLMARWREPRACLPVLRWLAMPGEGAFSIGGDVATQDGGRILASVWNGDMAPIEALILDRSANQYCRGAAVRALTLLGAWAEVPLDSIVDRLLWLAREGLEREPGSVWDSLASDSADIEALPVFPELRRAYAEGLIDPGFMQESELADVEAAPRGRTLEAARERYAPIDDVVAATAWWGRFAKERSVARTQPYKAPPEPGRNHPCPCGSGKKYKRCCGA
jgi:hypothetical protein